MGKIPKQQIDQNAATSPPLKWEQERQILHSKKAQKD